MSWFSVIWAFIHSDAGIMITAALVAAAIAVKSQTPEYTIAHKIADWVLQIAIAQGLYTTTKREPK